MVWLGGHGPEGMDKRRGETRQPGRYVPQSPVSRGGRLVCLGVLIGGLARFSARCRWGIAVFA